MSLLKDHLKDKLISITYFDIKQLDQYDPVVGNFIDLTDDGYLIFQDVYGSKNVVKMDKIRYINIMGEKKDYDLDE